MTYQLNLDAPHTPMPMLDPARETAELNERLIARAYAMVAEAERLVAQQRARIKVLESLSFTDELTGALNRRAFDMAIARETVSAQQDPGASGTLILIDLDGFKLINDRLGHAAGDAYLKAVVKELKSDLRDSDIVARIGGDEFAIILPRTRSIAGLRRAQQLQAQLNAAFFNWQDIALTFKASFGAVSYEGTEPASEVIKRADARLYLDKVSRKSNRRPS